MKCPNCKGTGKVEDNFRIPVWYGAQGNVQVTLQSEADNREYWNDSKAVMQTAKDFHGFLRSNAHGVFHDELARLFRGSKNE